MAMPRETRTQQLRRAAQQRRRAAEASTQAAHWQELPDEILQRVFSAAGPTAASMAAQTCKSWARAAADARLWRRWFSRRWPKAMDRPSAVGTVIDWRRRYITAAMKTRRKIIETEATNTQHRDAILPPAVFLGEYLCAKATLEVVMEGGSGRYFSCAKPVYTPLAAHYEWHQLDDIVWSKVSRIRVHVNVLVDQIKPRAKQRAARLEKIKRGRAPVMVLDSDFGRDAPPLSSDDDAAIVFHRVGEELTFARWREAATLLNASWRVPRGGAARRFEAFETFLSRSAPQRPRCAPNFRTAPPRPAAPRTDLDKTRLGLVSLKVVWNLRHKEDVFANEYVRSTDALLPIKGDAAEFPLLGDYKHVENHAVCRGELKAEWKAALLSIKIRRFAMCDVAVFASDGRIVAAASGAVDFASVGRLAGDYAYSEGEAYSFRFVHPTLTLHGKIVQEETDQLVVRDVLIALPLSHLDHVFGTSHQK